MNIKTELLKNYIADYVTSRIDDFDLDATKIADTTATRVLSEIQNVLKCETNTDFEAIEEIICIFEKYNIEYGARHDF